jgi:uncharacterized membrane protein YczE
VPNDHDRSVDHDQPPGSHDRNPGDHGRPRRDDSGPLAALRTGLLGRRLPQLYAGLALYGASLALMLRGDLGLAPWDVFHQGLAVRMPLSFGTIVILVSLVVLLAWIPLRQWPGLGTVSNALLVGVAVDLTLAVLPAPDPMAARIAFMAGGVVLNAVATAAYIGARLGPGPRDGLMTGLVARTGLSVRLIRTSIEATVVAIGWLLGGTVGIGTVVYALGIGPLVHVLLPRLTVPTRPGPRSREPSRIASGP